MISFRLHSFLSTLFLLISASVHGQSLPDALEQQIAKIGATWEPKIACVKKVKNQPPVTPAQIQAGEVGVLLCAVQGQGAYMGPIEGA